MATYINDKKLEALKAWAANHPEWGTTIGDLEYRFYRSLSMSEAGVSGGDIDARLNTLALAAALNSLTISASADDPQAWQQEFWTDYAAKPPTPAA